MRASATLALCGAALCGAALCGLTACGAGVDETAATITYNAKYAGPATFNIIAPLALTPAPPPLEATVTLSQLASTVTGTIDVVAQPPAAPDTVLSAGVTGHTTSDGLDLVVVQPLGCATHLSGPLTLGANGELSGALTGSNCYATGSDNLHLTLILARQ